MEEIDLNTQLIEIDLFNLFKIQIKKDFETCGLDVNFINDLPSDFFKLYAIRFVLRFLSLFTEYLESFLYLIILGILKY